MASSPSGVYGFTDQAAGVGVAGYHSGGGSGVRGESNSTGVGVYGKSISGDAVVGETGTGIGGFFTGFHGVLGLAGVGIGVQGLGRVGGSFSGETASLTLIPVTSTAPPKRTDFHEVGQIDIDSDKVDAFSADDHSFLKMVAGALGSLLDAPPPAPPAK